MARSSLPFDTRYARDVEREPDYRYGRRPAAPYRTEIQRRAALALKYGGNCSVCSEWACVCGLPVIPLTHAEPLATERDANGECAHAVCEVLSRDGRTLENAMRKCVTCGVEVK